VGRPARQTKVAVNAAVEQTDMVDSTVPSPSASPAARGPSRPGGAKTKVFIVANWAQGKGFSGGDRIFIELARHWRRKPDLDVHLFLSEEGWQFCQKKNLGDAPHTIWSPARWTGWGMAANFVLRTIHSLWRAATLPLDDTETYVYSSGDFWPDSLPAFLLKLRRRNVKWVPGFYLFAPRPWSAESPYKGAACLKGWLYWLTQGVAAWLMRKFADRIFCIVELDRDRFIQAGVAPERLVIVRGGVDVELAESVPEPPEKTYDAVFIGRFHPQKGGLELVDIWNEVVKARPGARLIMIGDDGPLKEKIEARIAALHLEQNIRVVLFLSDVEKAQIYKSSRVVVHPAVYDVGGMAACEAMVCGLPGVSFDLIGLRTYYPIGMLKAPERNLPAFARCILRLLDDPALYEKTRQDALKLAYSWDWRRRAEELLQAMRAGPSR
jgi:glycosyltransferase involved in cell wall biosynthesis